MVINAVAPMIAPMAGGAILSFEGTSWKSIFIFLSLIGFIIFAIIAWKLKETLLSEHRIPSSIGVTIKTMVNLLIDLLFISYVLVVVFVHVVIFSYVVVATFFFHEIYVV